MARKKIVALAGGVGAARFLDGLARVVGPERLFIIGNTGDDQEFHSLHVSPDLDTVTYTLAGRANPEHGWGLRGDTFHCLKTLKELGAVTWFQLGDRDLATHIYRTRLLQIGVSLTEVTRRIARALGVRAAIVPMSDDRVRTRVKTRTGLLELQTYLVRMRARGRVSGVRFLGASKARPAPGVIEAIRSAAGIVLCPSNPIISIGPILAVPGIRRALRDAAAPVAAVSPIVAGRALKGPAARMMKDLGLPVSAAGVAALYRNFLDVFILDRADQRHAPQIERLGMLPLVTNTIMTGPPQKEALARAVVRGLGLS